MSWRFKSSPGQFFPLFARDFGGAEGVSALRGGIELPRA